MGETAVRHEVRQVYDCDLSHALLTGLDEAFTALAESLEGLTDEQVAAEPLPGRHTIAVLAEHMLENLDQYTHVVQGRPAALTHERRYAIYAQVKGPEHTSGLPSADELRQRVQALREAALPILEAADEETLRHRGGDGEWFSVHRRTRADAYMRTICHTNAHLRQIWLLRGLLGAAEPLPTQHWA